MADRRRLSVYHLQYGPVRALAAVGLLAVVVDVAAAELAATLPVVAPGVSPSLVGRVAAATLWVALAAALAAVVRQQVAANPRKFIARQVVVEFLDQHRPTLRGWALALGATGVGAAVVRASWPQFVASLDGAVRVVRSLLRAGAPGSFDTLNLAFGVAFVLGFAALAWGADRAVVGGLRELQYRYYLRRWRDRL